MKTPIEILYDTVPTMTFEEFMEDAAGKEICLVSDAVNVAELYAAQFTGWMPIKEAPKDRVLIGLFDDLDVTVAEISWNKRYKVWVNIWHPKQPTHFLPLPFPPKQ